jgi:hypothetical protein
VLRNSTRGYLSPAVSTEPSPQVRRLAERAVREIETTEKRKIDKIDDERIAQYITMLETYLTSKSVEKAGTHAKDADRILKKMRTQLPG